MFKIQFGRNSKLRATSTDMSNKIVVMLLMFVMPYWRVMHLLHVLSEVDQPRKNWKLHAIDTDDSNIFFFISGFWKSLNHLEVARVVHMIGVEPLISS